MDQSVGWDHEKENVGYFHKHVEKGGLIMVSRTPLCRFGYRNRNSFSALIVFIYLVAYTLAWCRPSISWSRRISCRCFSSPSYAINQASRDNDEANIDLAVLSVPLAEATSTLLELCSSNNTRIVQMEGYVTAKRGFGSSFCFLDLSERGWERRPVQVMLKRQNYSPPMGADSDGNAPTFDGIFRSMLPGTYASITGVASPTRNPGEAVLLCREVDLLGLPRNPQHIRVILECTAKGLLPIASVARLYNQSAEQLQRDLECSGEGCYGKPFDSLAKMVLRSLPADERYPDLVKYKQSFRLPVAPAETYSLPESVKMATKVSVSGIKESAPPLSVEAVLSQFYESEDIDCSGSTLQLPACVHGWIQNRRRFDRNVTVLELVDSLRESDNSTTLESAPHFCQRLKCVSHPQILAVSDTMAHLLAPSAQVQIQGVVIGDKNDGAPTLWITNIRLLQASWWPSVTRFLLELVLEKRFSVPDAALALQVSESEVVEATNANALDLTARQWKAAEFSQALKLKAQEGSSVTCSTEEIFILEKYEAKCADQFPIQDVTNHVSEVHFSSFTSSTNETVVTHSREGSRWRRQKEPQLVWMGKQVLEVLQTHPNWNSTPGREFRILDVGGGQGWLANHLAQTVPEARIQVIDIASGAVQNGAMRSRRLGLSNNNRVSYTVGDASSPNLTLWEDDFDLVVALHACGGLTDVALSHARSRQIPFVICPCCYRSNAHLQVQASSSSSSSTSSVNISRWLDVAPTTGADEYTILTRLAETQHDLVLSRRATHVVGRLRAAATERDIPNIQVSLWTFPVAFSTRNLCLVGKYR
jgi:SAM-dependent methyltransferase